MSAPQTKAAPEVKYSIVPLSSRPKIQRNTGKYLKILEAAKSLKLGATPDEDKTIRIPLGTTEKSNRNAALTIGGHLKNYPHQTRTEERDGKKVQVEYRIRVSTQTEGKQVNAYILYDEVVPESSA